MFGPNTIALPSAPGSIGFCPPTAVRLLPTNTTVAVLVKKPQFAGRVDQQAIQLAFAKLRGRAQISLRKINFTPRSRNCRPTSRQRSKCRGTSTRNSFGKPRPQPLRHFRQNHFLAVVRAAADQNRRVRRHAELPQQRRHVEPCGVHPAWPRQISSCRRRGSASGRQPTSRNRAASSSFCAPTPANEANSGRNRKPNRW